MRPITKSLLALFLFVIFVAAPHNAHALSFDLAFQHRRSTPKLLNKSADITSAEGSFAKVEPRDKFSYFNELLVHVFIPDRAEQFQWGLLGRYGFAQKVTQNGYNSSNTLTMAKSTTYGDWTIGPIARYYFLTPAAGSHNFFTEAHFAMGALGYESRIDEPVSLSTHSLNASATVVEMAAAIGGEFYIADVFMVTLTLGYSRVGSTILTADSASGTRYASVLPGRRLLVNDDGTTKDFSINRAGPVIAIGAAARF